MTVWAADGVYRADFDEDRGTGGPARALGDWRGCAGASGSHIGIDRQVERATRPGSCQRARGTAAKRAAAADRLHDDAIGLIARRVDSRADGDVHRAAATRALWHRSSRKTAQHGPGRRSRTEEHPSELQSQTRTSS